MNTSSNEPSVNAIIFDLGGVIINLDPEQSFLALQARSTLNKGMEELLQEHRHFFFDYERGLLTDEEFRSGLRDHFRVRGTDQEIDEAWNRMLLDIPPSRLQFIKRLRDHYRLFVLSNTCQIHVDAFQKRLADKNGLSSLEELFEKVYYSHKTGFRKPMPEIYRMVIEENKLEPAKTLFIDDNRNNVESAKKLGILAILMEQNGNLEEHFAEYINEERN